jgi:hypothetical protein
MAPRKETKKIKVRDLKPKKDAKGGGHQMQGHQMQGHQNQGHQNQGHVPLGPHSNT